MSYRHNFLVLIMSPDLYFTSFFLFMEGYSATFRNILFLVGFVK